MPARRRPAAVVTAVTALGIAALTLSATPASAHGSLGDPVSRVAQCYAEGPESPASAACRAAVTAGGTQALYDWNGIRIGDAGGRHRALIPDGELCGAGNDEFKGLDLARADWPATGVHSGSYPFRYRVTAPHKGTFEIYLTKPGYDAAKPLSWADLDLEHPVATATDPVAANGFYSFSGILPERSGRQLLYAIWQRSDSPEAFYSCSDVMFGASGEAGAGSGTSDSASAPSEEQIEAGADESTVGHGDHGDHASNEQAAADAPRAPSATPSATPSPARSATPSAGTAPRTPLVRPEAAGAAVNLAETGGTSGTRYLAVGGAGALALGATTLLLSVRRRAAGAGRPGH
ncbi:lytic polysaccharide monooxygenase auxiliary activity family 9 protein [Streptomyces sp. WI04-05B]|uniref:lytic polysaccharide monooxygenase auxiliary activity family 9 protein n=1 Tax=Streptomyces TaxID=1883 RepID=UPI0029A47330|nr:MULTISPECIES: lytic polysaccharide monooxygenase [unclassified Streptomyces]MDX2547271.1 lytic polysaccharide monooxygenase [Streptomyces sp. WI04-05B]MDX2590158.1 lytic polysaccharide monooxygenase [Streptomyces sp. WI04-05A]